jgi:hypothetical protein
MMAVRDFVITPQGWKKSAGNKIMGADSAFWLK